MVRQESQTTMKENKIIAIIRQITGQNDPEESEELQHWEQASPDNHTSAEAIRKTWEWSGQYDKQTQPDVDAGWNRLKSRIAADRVVKETPKPTAKQVSMMPRFLMRVAVAAAVVLSISFLAKNFLQPSNRAFVVSTTAGQQDKVELTDGSIVWLNENSSLTFGNPSNKSERRAKLTGEAFFEVAENPNKPFIIETADTKVEVLGTSFNVRALGGEAFTEVQVKTGKVSFQNVLNEEELILTANDKGIFQHSSKKMIKEKDQSLNALAWQSRTLSFQNTPLKKVLSDLERYYKINLELSDVDLYGCNYTSPFTNTQLTVVLESISTAFGMELEKVNETNYRLKGGACQ